MNEKTDGRRVKMTKALLKTSLIELMKTKSIHNISIKEICSGADINRSTFYRHYNTQYDLYDEMTHELLDKLISIFLEGRTEGKEIVDSMEECLAYIEKEREVFLVILSEKGNLQMGETFIKAIAPIAENNGSELFTYVVQFVAAGLTSVLWSWLNKPNRRSPHDLAILIFRMMKRGIVRTMIGQAVPPKKSVPTKEETK